MTTVDVYLVDPDDRGALFADWAHGYGSRPSLPLRFAIRLEVVEPPEAAAEVAYAICNSYPVESFADPRYVADVERYREALNRSLSMGDVVVVNGLPMICAAVGFTAIESFPHEGGPAEEAPMTDR